MFLVTFWAYFSQNTRKFTFLKKDKKTNWKIYFLPNSTAGRESPYFFYDFFFFFQNYSSKWWLKKYTICIQFYKWYPCLLWIFVFLRCLNEWMKFPFLFCRIAVLSQKPYSLISIFAPFYRTYFNDCWILRNIFGILYILDCKERIMHLCI